MLAIVYTSVYELGFCIVYVWLVANGCMFSCFNVKMARIMSSALDFKALAPGPAQLFAVGSPETGPQPHQAELELPGGLRDRRFSNDVRRIFKGFRRFSKATRP